MQEINGSREEQRAMTACKPCIKKAPLMGSCGDGAVKHEHTHIQARNTCQHTQVYLHNRDLFIDFYSGRNAPFSNASII